MFDVTTFPPNPGCYLFKDHDVVLYVGKAKNLRNRLKSYEHTRDVGIKTRRMLQHATSVDFVVTDTEMEALLLENTLIKKHQPRYNIRLKDAKSYAYLQLTDEEFPRLLVARRKVGKGTFYGPFVSAQERDYILEFLRKTFALRTCKRMPKKPCLRYHIHLCDAPCIGGISKEEYAERIKKVTMILSGDTNQVLEYMREEMKRHASRNRFELALQLRDQIAAVERLSERQKSQREKTYNEDIIHYLVKDDQVYLMLFHIYKGTLTAKQEFIFEVHDEFLEEFLVQYYSDNPIPKELIVPISVSMPVHEFLHHHKGSKVMITTPMKGEKKQLLDLVLKNIELTFFAKTEKIRALQTALHLQDLPQVIECFDISHLSGTSMVGSMVQFRNGVPDKTNYRRFRIRSVEGIDDVAAIAEVVRRRYGRLQREDDVFPDLVLIDGGRGQLNAALHELKKLRVKLPVVAIAKQFEDLYLPGGPQPLRLGKKHKALMFIQEIRDEAHRFALKYNRLLRSKEMIA
jgi:excinuclease ABC subunit C